MKPTTPIRAILDTNVFVAAGFKKSSVSAGLLTAVRTGHIQMIWAPETRDETRRLLTKIPPLSWDAAADLFTADGQFTEPLDLGATMFVTDPQDRKFAALSLQSGAVLVSSDDDLLRHADRLDVLNPGAFQIRFRGQLA